jgi:hypothetical protein
MAARVAPPPYTEKDIGRTELQPTYRADLRPGGGDVFCEAEPIEWRDLTWEKVGKPYRVERWTSDLKRYERNHDGPMPVKEQWEHFNRNFQRWFDTDPVRARKNLLHRLGRHARHLDIRQALAALEEVVQWSVWNKVHRIQDAIWDPRGKRALFEGLDYKQPRILFLGAAEGYEAMQLWATYPGGEVVLVDYDDYCRTDRFGNFPEAYPFLGEDVSTGGRKVWYRDQMNLHYQVDDIRNLNYGREFDIVLSVGLLEHFPDEYKPLTMEWHRKFLKPGGVAIMTTPRAQLRSKLWYWLFADYFNYSYRELMDVRQMGLYAYENGFEILRHGVIRAHNGLVLRPR